MSEQGSILGSPQDKFFFEAKRIYEESKGEKWDIIFNISRALRQTELVKVINKFMEEAGYFINWEKDQETIKKGAVQYHQTKSEHHRLVDENHKLKAEIERLKTLNELDILELKEEWDKESLSQCVGNFLIKVFKIAHIPLDQFETERFVEELIMQSGKFHKTSWKIKERK